jgi:uncharacterized protein
VARELSPPSLDRGMERRTFTSPIELRDEPTGGSGNTLRGYASKFGVDSLPLYDRNVCDTEFIEVIAPGAFANTLKDSDVAALYNHDTNCVLGRLSSGTLTLEEDSTGLAFVVTLPDTTYARDVKELVKRGDIKGCSFGFQVLDAVLEPRPDDLPLRTIKEIKLFEISPAVCFPAYEETEVSLRSKGMGKPASTPILDYCARRLQLLS